MICGWCRTAGDLLGTAALIEPQGLAEAQRAYHALHDRCTGCCCQHRDAVLAPTFPDVPTEESMARALRILTSRR